ncbi:hypothetical protein C4D60_Mb08t17810 [Musa balbisiana]|uniref:Uncharacterized protein n=1 Tax=Musa balbisiana TaxID=52838 RepID=A0A4S8K4J0_MUSBA|nr:hypothetical protein C4D60_Mb08t17810 [Musa balbisiana]
MNTMMASANGEVIITILQAVLLGLRTPRSPSFNSRSHIRGPTSSRGVWSPTTLEWTEFPERSEIIFWGWLRRSKPRAAMCSSSKKGILSDAVTDLSLHNLAKAKILVIKDVEREDIEFITKTLNCLPIASIEHFREEKLGLANCVEEVPVGDGKIVKMTGIKDMGRTATELVRGSNQLVIDEAERSHHDALCVVRLEHMPTGKTNAGINMRKGQITNIWGKCGAATAG